MFVKEIIIEGFKSYAQQTIVSAFDPHFNAITGLNGSGKSNILDSICFVLGITNLSQVRATNLQELIYKGGNAGITKATVSITFDNLDKNQSPPGYHEYEEITITRQISVGGKHKYLINGQNATAQRVADLFCSVQLNVNNPNFLIMQGKIMKVLNMKPVEILSMIEEAAGTKTYDMKKENALQTIEKKNSKLSEIERVLKEDITPAIEKLKQERSAYIEYQQCEREYLHLHKISIAYQYQNHQESLVKIQSDSKEIENEFKSNQNRIVEINELIESLKDEIKTLKQNMMSGDDLLNELETKLKENQMETTKLKSEINNLNSTIKSEKKKSTQIEKNIKENRSIIESKEKKLEEMKTNHESSHTLFTKAEADLKLAQQQYEALCCGFVLNEDGQSLETIQDQLLNIQNKISERQTQIKQAEIRLNKAKSESDKLKKELETSARDYDEKLKIFQIKEQLANKLKDELDSLNHDPNKWESLNNQKRDLNNQLFKLNDKMQQFYSKYPQLNFDYKNPQPNFDRSKVKGLVCNLFTVKDPKFATALETAAGGKMYNLVVDNDQTGKLILQHGELKRKVTIIPMNQIRPYVLSDNVVNTAKNLVGHDMVFSALSLIDYDPLYRPVMEFVFGSRLICMTLDSAKKVAFHPQVMANSITLDGDHFDPEGTLTGGARGERANVLMQLMEIKSEMNSVNSIKNQMNRIEEEMNEEKQNSIKYSRIKREYDSSVSQMDSAKMSLEQTSHHQKLEKYESITKEIETKTFDVQNFTKELETLREKEIELDKKVKNKDNNKEQEKKDAQKKIDDAKLFLEKHLKTSTQYQQEYDSTKLEVNVLNSEISAYQDELAKIEESINSLQEKIKNINEKVAEYQTAEEEISIKLNERKDLIKEKNKTINSKSNECDKLEKERNSIDLKIKEFEHRRNNFKEQLAQSSERLKNLIESHEWINDEKDNFGKPNSMYDFKKQNIKEVHHRLNEIKSRKEKLSKQVDMRAMGLLAKKEEEYEELNKRRMIVLKDRATLETTIEDLEKIKAEVLHKAFDSINKDLGSIFRTLLPGASAKLESCNKSSLLDGVEFKVAFGDVWKESLTELSGGQRSLVALSLILALLLYKPAPLYILDEVDAALDTSHTQNIGLMIKKHFKHSQFIIVSLKDGMFNNANVLYKTKLIDGVSTLQRFEQKKKITDRNNENRNVRSTIQPGFNNQAVDLSIN